MQPFFTLLKSISHEKRSWDELMEEERNSFNNWIVNRFISMHEDYCGLVNVIQKNTWQMPPEKLYNVYKNLLPSNNIFFGYIKSKNTSKYNLDDLKLLGNYFELSLNELKECIEFMDSVHLENVLDQIKGKNKNVSISINKEKTKTKKEKTTKRSSKKS